MRDKIFLSVIFILVVGMAYFLTKILGGTDDDFYHALLMLILFKTMETNFRNNDKIKQEYVDSVKVNETSKSVAVKEEEVKEKEESIWKSVSELPEDNYTVIIKAKGGYGEIFFGAYREDTQNFMDEAMKFVYPKKSIDKYCTLTDFINDYEKLKERVSKLEGK